MESFSNIAWKISGLRFFLPVFVAFERSNDSNQQRHATIVWRSQGGVPKMIHSLKLTASLHLKIGQIGPNPPKGNVESIPTIHFQGRKWCNVSFREGNSFFFFGVRKFPIQKVQKTLWIFCIFPIKTSKHVGFFACFSFADWGPTTPWIQHQNLRSIFWAVFGMVTWPKNASEILGNQWLIVP